MALTGHADGPPLPAPGRLVACAEATAAELERLAVAGGLDSLAGLDAPALLGERAALLGLARRGATAPGGSCRLLPAADRWLALNLARPDDVALLPAWLGEGDCGDPWDFVRSRIAQHRAAEVVERARLLGLAAAVAEDPPQEASPWCRVAARGRPVPRRRGETPRVVDLSSLWAGPLCAHLLGLVGARVIKVESTRRPDGARLGPPAFFDLMNGAKRSVALDFSDAGDRAQLRRLLGWADIVVESARPRALSQLGIDAEALVRAVPGLVWVSITGYGRRDPGANWVAFGDDAAAAAGLVVATAAGSGTPLFCGDAIADPLTGLHAALAALRAWREGGGVLLDLALREVAAHALGPRPARENAKLHRSGDGWEIEVGGERQAVLPPRARPVCKRAPSLGADTAAVLREVGAAC
jgi:hypothetical protein